jgi:hypothetical protein
MRGHTANQNTLRFVAFDSDEVSFGKCTTGAGLEVLFEGDSARLPGEFQRHDQPPRAVLGGVMRPAGIVNLESPLDVAGKSDIVTFRNDIADEHIYKATVSEHA